MSTSADEHSRLQPESQTTEVLESVQLQPEVDSWEDICAVEQPSSSSPQIPKPETHTEQAHGTEPCEAAGPVPVQKSGSEAVESSTESRPQTHKQKGNGRQEISPPSQEKVAKQKESKPSAVAPKKSEDEKENVNIVFIGHVGEDRVAGYIGGELILTDWLFG